MADKKYKNVALTQEQSALVYRAADLFRAEMGVRLTRSQCLAMLANKYIREAERGAAIDAILAAPNDPKGTTK